MFKSWPKTTRLYSDVIITEKIDGTNCAIIFGETPYGLGAGEYTEGGGLVIDGREAVINTQSRNQLCTPSKDHMGFATWAYDNADALFDVLGFGYHYGEWTIHGVDKPMFFLFNTYRWTDKISKLQSANSQLSVVPVLYEGKYSTEVVENTLEFLRIHGSQVTKSVPEGVCVYFHDNKTVFKAYTNLKKKRK